MINVFMSLLLAFIAGCTAAPKPPQVSLTGKVDPVNFHVTPIKNIVITSQQAQGCWRRQFAYKMDDPNPAPEFFYAIAHADQIIAYIKPPAINLNLKKLKTDLKGYGIATPVDLFAVDALDQQPQIILECIKFERE